MGNYDFSGWATRNDLLCGDGCTIRKNAFKDCNGQTVPLIWNHDHVNQKAVIGHALLENREDGIYAYCKLNDTDGGKHAKTLVEHGDVRSLSIYANKLKRVGNDVVHGIIRELSLVLAGANPGAFIDYVVAHGDEDGDGMIVNYDENAISIYHSEELDDKNKEEKPVEKENKKEATDKTLQDVWDTMTEEQQTVANILIGMALEGQTDEKEKDKSEGGDEDMKHNVFDQDEIQKGTAISHADQMAIVELAKQSGVGSLRTAMKIYAEENEALAHGFESPESLFPDYELVKKGAPELVERDQSWIAAVMKKVHKSPITRIRTRQADARIAELRAKGYQNKGDEKKLSAAIKLISRTTDPQTVYIKDAMHRDDILDIVDFDVVNYQWNVMRHAMEEELALAMLIGDGRDDGDPDKIHEDHIRSIWNDDEEYTIHVDIDLEAAKTELQGSETGARFGENYIYAEAIITAALYAREKYKGTGTPDYYCTPHALNVMLLARDLNGRRIYDSKADLAAALNVNEIHTVEQFEGKTRTTKGGKTKKLLGLFVNMADYQLGNTKDGDITKFEDFDMDFNKYKYMLETRKSGALTRIASALAIEEEVTA